MNEELIKQVEQLLDYGYGDSLRLDSIIDALRNGRPLYSSDQKYVDMLISKYLYPHIEEVQDLKNQIGSLEKKIENMKGEYQGKKKKVNGQNILNYCNECGSMITKTYEFCPKCGTPQNEYATGGVRTGQLKQKRYAGMAAAGIILIIFGGISFIILSEFTSVCGSSLGVFAQILNQNTLQECFEVQVFYASGIIMLIAGIILLVVRAVKRR